MHSVVESTVEKFGESELLHSLHSYKSGETEQIETVWSTFLKTARKTIKSNKTANETNFGIYSSILHMYLLKVRKSCSKISLKD